MTEIPFTDQAIREFEQLWHNALSTYNLALQALQDKDINWQKGYVKWRAN